MNRIGRPPKNPKTYVANLEAIKINTKNSDPQEIISSRIPEELLSKFEIEDSQKLYEAILSRLIEDTLPEGSTILQILVAERAAYYWAQAHEVERNTNKINEEYKFFIKEFNSNLEILRELAIRNLPAQQVKMLAKKTINVIDRVVEDPTIKDAIIKEIIQDFTIEIPSFGIGKDNKKRLTKPSFFG